MATRTDMGMPQRLEGVHHTPSPGMQAMLEAALGWEPVAPVLEVTGQADAQALAGCTELGGVLAATLMPDA